MKKSLRKFFFAVSVVVLLVSGCQKTYFDLELHPDGDTLQRTYSSEFEEEEISRLSGVYGHKPVTEVFESPDGKKILKYSFVGEFQHATPNDIGGSGFLLHCDSAIVEGYGSHVPSRLNDLRPIYRTMAHNGLHAGGNRYVGDSTLENRTTAT